MSGRMEEEPWFGNFIISEANGYRSRGMVTIAQGAQLQVGTLMDGDAPATDPADITSILTQAVDARSTAVRATVLARHAEVNDAFIAYGSLDHTAVNGTLAGLGIVVRRGVLEQSIATPAS